MAQGYRHRPVDEAERFVDGWYRTGDLGELDDEGMLRILGRSSDVDELDALTPVALQDTLCALPPVRYAVLVHDGGRWVAAVEAWPGHVVDVDRCRTAVAARHGRPAADALRLVEVDRMPLTEQGKPDRPAILALGAASA